MKKKTKKLVLAKETVRKLGEGLLVKAAGGDTVSYCAAGCATGSCRICLPDSINDIC
ncbi:MAG TPA: hypothetical protein VEL74_03155 [Thermoanaerobaculia bacterium]|nr:hypothetical protein [Thermoanaerobaculia bacterium]